MNAENGRWDNELQKKYVTAQLYLSQTASITACKISKTRSYLAEYRGI